MNVKRIHYQGGLTQDRFLENGGGHRKPTLLRVKALLGDDKAAQPRTFGLVIDTSTENADAASTEPARTAKIVPILVVLDGKRPVRE